MDSLLISITGVFQQIVEDLDCGGMYGNFLEMLSTLLAADANRATFARKLALPYAATLVAARPNPGFIVPPEHRKQVGSYVGRLWQREVAGMPFKVALDLVRNGAVEK